MAQAVTTQELFEKVEVPIPTDERPSRLTTERAQANRKAYHDITRFLGIRQATCDTHGLVY